MSESFVEKRKRELGISDSPNTISTAGSSSSFIERRKIELGLTPKPQPTIADKINSGKLPSFDVGNSPLLRNAQADFENDYRKQLDAMQAEDNPKHFETDRNAMLGVKARNLPVIGTALKKIDAFSQNPVVDKVADLARSFYVPGASAANVASFAGAAEKGLAKVAPKLANTSVGRGISTLVAPGVPFGVGAEMMNKPDPTAKDLALGGLYGAAGGAVLGGLGKGIGAGLGVIADRYAGTKIGDALGRMTGRGSQAIEPTEQAAQDILALPQGRGEARYNAAINRSNLTSNESPIMGTGTVRRTEPLGLPEPNVGSPTRARVETRPNEYTQKLENLFNTANQMKFTPGRELEELESLWSQMAGPKDPKLDELIDLAYPKQAPKVNSESLSKARTLQQSREVAGVPGLVKSMADRYQSTVSEAAAPRQRFGVIRPTPDAAPEITVPQRKFATSEPTVIQSSPASVRPDIRPAQQPLQPRGFSQTLSASEKTPTGFKEKLSSAYKPVTNEETLAQANKRITKDIDESTSFVLGNSRFTAEKATTAQRLIDHYNSTGNYRRAVDIAEKVSEEATRAGQAVQALSMFNRLSPEGVLIYAQRLARKTNENISVLGKEVKVTEDMAAKLTDLTQVAQKMTGVKDLSNDVLSILEKAKSGTKLSETESSTLKRFVNESKQFIEETTRKPRDPRPPQAPKDKRVRDAVASFADAQEKAAKDRLRARGMRVSSTPLDVWADYAIIGAAKMAKGTIKFADWSEEIVKDLGEEVRPLLRNLYERSAEAFNQSTKKVTEQTISQAEKLTEKLINSKQFAESEANALRSLAKNVSRLSGEEKRLASQDLQVILRELDKPSILKRVSSTQTIGQLLNPKTQVRNALGNELFYRVERLNKLITTPIDIARSKITGGDRTVTFRTNNQGEYWSNWMRGLKAGWKGANVNGLETQYDLASPAFKGKYNPLTYMEKALGSALKSFDTAAYMRAYNNTVGELATLKAINEGSAGNKELIKKYIREADDNVLKIADEYGRYVTFQDNNLISKGLVGLKKGLNFKQEFGLGDLVLKYPKTPGALLMRALEYSPAGFLRSLSILARPLWKAEPNTAEVTQALSRAIIGTFGLTGAGYFLLDKGILTGAASKDKDVRDLQRSAGQGQYQVNLSALSRFVRSGFDPESAKLKEGDSLYTYDWMQPLSMAVSIGANTSKNIGEGNPKLSGVPGTVYNSLEGGLGTLTEQSVLSGVKSAAQGYPGQTITDKIMDIIADIPSSFVPTAANQIRQLDDNAKRETYSPNKLEQSLNVAQAKIPGLAGKLPQQYDTLGKTKTTQQNNSAFNVLFNPGNSSKYELSPEAKWIVDLINETGDETLAPRVPSKKITIQDPNNPKKNIQFTLNGDQFSRYQQLQGQKTQENIVKQYKADAPQKNRIDKMRDILTKAGDDSKKSLKKELGVR